MQQIRDRVRALLVERGVTQTELAEAIGRSPSWVNAFLSGKRNANKVALLAQIGRYFGVSIGYLLGEKPREFDPKTATLLSYWDDLSAEHRFAVSTLAETFWKQQGGGGSTAPPSDLPAEPSNTGGRSNGPRRKKQ